jgi:hypothetical protein
MVTTLPPDPLLDTLKRGGTGDDAETGLELTGHVVLRNAVTADVAPPWRGGPLRMTAGIRWCAVLLPLRRLGMTRVVPLQTWLPVYRVTVDEHGIALVPRWPWLRGLIAVLTWWLTPDLPPQGMALWSTITGIRRRARIWRSASRIEFCVDGWWGGVVTIRTTGLDDMWSAVVHYYRGSRAR